MDPYDIGEAFAEIEAELISSMIRNMRHHRAEETKEGFEWTQWQVEQLKALEAYKKANQKKYKGKFRSINNLIDEAIKEARSTGNMEQEIEILEAIKKGFLAYSPRDARIVGEFFKLNDRKLEALIKATKDDLKKAEHAMLRMAEDQYRQIIFNAQVYANTGAGTYEKAVDMATEDFISRGINCVEYANGARHTIKDYADMALRTAAKRAYLTGEGEKRMEWGISTVIMNKRGNPCPKCLPFVGKVLIDDVWSGGGKEDGDYPLMSRAIELGLYHPRCKDSHSTYFEGISTPPDDSFSKREVEEIKEGYTTEQKRKAAMNNYQKFSRLADNALDKENKQKYKARADYWHKEYARYYNQGYKNGTNLKKDAVSTKKNMADAVENVENGGIIEMYRKGNTHRKSSQSGRKIIDKATYHKITNPAIRAGADIRIAEGDFLEHIREHGTAVTIGDIIFFTPEMTVSDVLEEVYHFYQNKRGLNNKYGKVQREILNEIDAKEYLLRVSDKYKIPKEEIEDTKEHLESYKKQMKEMMEKGDWDYE